MLCEHTVTFTFDYEAVSGIIYETLAASFGRVEDHDLRYEIKIFMYEK
jgi:hypothetical protein